MGVVKPQAQTEFTPSQIARFVADGGDPEVIETGDPVMIGRSMADVATRKQRAIDAAAAAKSADVEQRRTDKAFQDALNAIPDLDFAEDERTGGVDETKFKRGDIVIPRLKRALGLSPDPKIRAMALEAGDDAKKLKAAAMKAYEVPVNTGPKWVAPPRP